jgi:hypothetical protein
MPTDSRHLSQWHFQESPSNSIRFVGAFGERFESEDMDVGAVEKSAVLPGNFLRTMDSTQTVSILQRMADNCLTVQEIIPSLNISAFCRI